MEKTKSCGRETEIRLIYNLESYDVAFNHHIKYHPKEGNKDHILECIGNDPQIIFPNLKYSPDIEYILEIEAVNFGETFEIFRISIENGKLATTRIASITLQDDFARFVLLLNPPSPINIFRIDPGNKPLKINVKRIDILGVGISSRIKEAGDLKSRGNSDRIFLPMLLKCRNPQLPSNTLVFMKTHFINEQVINEYAKMKKSGYKALLLIENSKEIFPIVSSEPILKARIRGVDCDVVVANPDMFRNLSIPLIGANGYSDRFSQIMWHNCDYTLYLIRELFPKYEYYWQLEYDVYLNASNYKSWLDDFANYSDDFIINWFSIAPYKGWTPSKLCEWIYKNTIKYSGIFPVVRATGRAIDFLHRQRLKHEKSYKHKLKNNLICGWVHCECFAPIELANGGFSCIGFPKNNVNISAIFKETQYFYDDKIYEHFNGILYHPIKDKVPLDQIPECNVLI